MSIMLCVGVGAWAEEGDTHDFSQDFSQLLNDNATIASIDIAEQSYPVKKVIVSYRYNKTLTDAVTVSVSVGGTSWGSQNIVGTDKSYTTMEFSGDAITGAIAISFTNNTGSGTGHGTFYVNNVQLVEGSSVPDSRTAVNMTGFSATYTTIVVGNKTATNVTNDQAGWTEAYKYTSSDDAVATVDANGEITAVAKGSARITATLNVDKDDEDYKVGETKSMTVDITVKNPDYTATFSVNGVTTSNDFEAGTKVTFPSNPASMGGKVFVGWKAGSGIDGTTDVAPSFADAANTNMPAANTTYYAVFATLIPGESADVTDDLTVTSLGIGSFGNSYDDVSDIKVTSNAVYVGNCAGKSTTDPAIQMRSNNSNSGFVSTTSGGKLKKVVLVWNSATASGRTIDVYGKNTTYSAASDLYNTSNQGTKLGSIVYGTSTELDIKGDYTSVGLRSNSGALYLDKISITWSAGSPDTYAKYCTTVTEDVTVSSAGYATFVPAGNVDFSSNDDITAYTITAAGESATLNEVGEVPAGTPVLVKASEGTYTISSIASASSVGTNLLKVAAADMNGDGATQYILANDASHGVGFYLLSTEGTKLSKGKVYLEVPAAEAKAFIGFFNNESSAIEGVAVESLTSGRIYNLAGQQMKSLQKGINIVNGKKIFVK